MVVSLRMWLCAVAATLFRFCVLLFEVAQDEVDACFVSVGDRSV